MLIIVRRNSRLYFAHTVNHKTSIYPRQRTHQSRRKLCVISLPFEAPICRENGSQARRFITPGQIYRDTTQTLRPLRSPATLEPFLSLARSRIRNLIPPFEDRVEPLVCICSSAHVILLPPYCFGSRARHLPMSFGTAMANLPTRYSCTTFS